MYHFQFQSIIHILNSVVILLRQSMPDLSEILKAHLRHWYRVAKKQFQIDTVPEHCINSKVNIKLFSNKKISHLHCNLTFQL